jgi:hypothetical protein
VLPSEFLDFLPPSSDPGPVFAPFPRSFLTCVVFLHLIVDKYDSTHRNAGSLSPLISLSFAPPLRHHLLFLLFLLLLLLLPFLLLDRDPVATELATMVRSKMKTSTNALAIVRWLESETHKAVSKEIKSVFFFRF